MAMTLPASHQKTRTLLVGTVIKRRGKRHPSSRCCGKAEIKRKRLSRCSLYLLSLVLSSWLAYFLSQCIRFLLFDVVSYDLHWMKRIAKAKSMLYCICLEPYFQWYAFLVSCLCPRRLVMLSWTNGTILVWPWFLVSSVELIWSAAVDHMCWWSFLIVFVNSANDILLSTCNGKVYLSTGVIIFIALHAVEQSTLDRRDKFQTRHFQTCT